MDCVSVSNLIKKHWYELVDEMSVRLIPEDDDISRHGYFIVTNDIVKEIEWSPHYEREEARDLFMQPNKRLYFAVFHEIYECLDGKRIIRASCRFYYDPRKISFWISESSGCVYDGIIELLIAELNPSVVIAYCSARGLINEMFSNVSSGKIDQ